MSQYTLKPSGNCFTVAFKILSKPYISNIESFVRLTNKKKVHGMNIYITHSFQKEKKRVKQCKQELLDNDVRRAATKLK